MKRDDALWKGLLEDIFDDFLRFYVPNADEHFDFTKNFVFLDKELEQLFPNTQDEFNPKYVDKLVKVFTKSGKEEWILVQMEVQGSTDIEFEKRMFTYYYRILDKYDTSINAFAILTYNNKKFKPSVYEIKYLGTSIRYEFNSYKVLEADSAALEASNNPFAMIILAVQIALKKGKLADNSLFDLKLSLSRKLLLKQFSKDKIRTLFRFIKLYIRFENSTFIHKFEEKIDEITNRQTTMGLEEFVIDRAKRIGLKEGRQEGRQEGKQETDYENKVTFVTNLLQQTDFSVDKIATLACVDNVFVEKIKITLS